MSPVKLTTHEEYQVKICRTMRNGSKKWEHRGRRKTFTEAEAQRLKMKERYSLNDEDTKIEVIPVGAQFIGI